MGLECQGPERYGKDGIRGLTPVSGQEAEKIKVEPNNVRKIREGLLMSKAELARRAKLSVLTIDRVEKGMACRMDTKRKIILSLGLALSDRDKVFKG
jgi:DNA-binding XRE family transcriptional regulator